MKDMESRLAFVKARAEGKSYSTITKELGIAKATCTSWEKALRSDIDALRREHLEELYTAYNMSREARIKTLGGLLQDLDNAIAQKPLEDLPADKLLELRLKYGRELKEEYRELSEVETDNTLDGLLEQYNRIYELSRTGEATPTDVKAQLSILEAKRETIYKLTAEQAKEEKDPLSIDFYHDYKSKLIRHEES